MRTVKPAALRWRAQTNPSPPLFPRPASTIARPRVGRAGVEDLRRAGPGFGAVRPRHQVTMARADSFPARSMSVAADTPLEIAAWSMAAISLAVTRRGPLGSRTSVLDENDRDGVRCGVGEGEIDAPLPHEPAGRAVELHGGAGALASDHLHFAPDGDAPHLER